MNVDSDVVWCCVCSLRATNVASSVGVGTRISCEHWERFKKTVYEPSH
jgi:hypothetical protein